MLQLPPRFRRALTIVLLAAFTPLAGAQITPRWFDAFHDPAFPDTGESCWTGIDDGTGALIAVSGSLFNPAAPARVRKYTAGGTLAWDVPLTPARARWNVAHADSAGGAYLTGYNDNPGWLRQIVATRVDAFGTQPWTHVWSPNSISYADHGRSTLDSSGNLWLAGSFSLNSTLYVRALSPNGTFLFHNTFPDTSYLRAGFSVALPNGGIAMTVTRDAEPNIQTFGPTGQPLWVDEVAPTFTGFFGQYSELVVDANSGRIAACGSSHPNAQYSGGLLRMCDSTGTVLLTVSLREEFSEPTDLYDTTFASDGALWAVGWIGYGAAQRELVLRYDSSGVRTLLRITEPNTGGPSSAFKVLAGNAGQVWIESGHGLPSNPNSFRYLVSELDATGALNWRFPLSRPGGHEFLTLIRTPRGFLGFGGVGSPYLGASDALVAAFDARELPDGYCSSQTNSLGCVPTLTFTGQSSASEPSGFVVAVGSLRNQTSGLFFYGTSGPASLPFAGGVRCVAPPLRRTPVQTSGGSSQTALDCSGRIALDLNALASTDPLLTVPGTPVFVQAWSRDGASATGTNLSSALRYVVRP